MSLERRGREALVAALVFAVSACVLPDAERPPGEELDGDLSLTDPWCRESSDLRPNDAGAAEVQDGAVAGEVGPPVAAALAVVDQAALTRAGGCAVLERGGVACWERDGEGRQRLWTGEGRSEALGVVSRSRLSCAVVVGGEVSCWEGASGPRGVPWLAGARDLALTEGFLCGALGDGTVACGDWPVSGSVDDGGESLPPVRLPGLRRVVEVTGGRRSICARSLEGGVACFGETLIEDARAGRFFLGAPPGAVSPVADEGVQALVVVATAAGGPDVPCVAFADGLRCLIPDGEGDRGAGAPVEVMEGAVASLAAVDGAGLVCALIDGQARCVTVSPGGPVRQLTITGAPPLRALSGGEALAGATRAGELFGLGSADELLSLLDSEGASDLDGSASGSLGVLVEGAGLGERHPPPVETPAGVFGPFLPVEGLLTPWPASAPPGGRCYQALRGSAFVLGASADDDPELNRASLQVVPNAPVEVNERLAILAPVKGHLDESHARPYRLCEASLRAPPPLEAPALSSQKGPALRAWARDLRLDGPLVRELDLPAKARGELEALLRRTHPDARPRWVRALAPGQGGAGPLLVVSGQFDRQVLGVDAAGDEVATLGMVLAILDDDGQDYRIVDEATGRMHSEAPWRLMSSRDVDGDGHQDTILIATDYDRGALQGSFALALSGWRVVDLLRLLPAAEADAAPAAYQGGCFGLVDGRPAYLVFLRHQLRPGDPLTLETHAFVLGRGGRFQPAEQLYGQVLATALRASFFEPEHTGMDTWHLGLEREALFLCPLEGAAFDVVSNDILEGGEAIPNLETQPLARLWRLSRTREGVGRDLAVVRLR